MKRSIPQVIQECAVYIDGKGYLGVVKNLKPPKIEQESIEVKGALSTNYASGVLKPMEIEFKIQKVDLNIFAGFGINTFSKYVPFLFKASIYEAGSKESKSLSMAATGDILELDIAEFESGKEIEVSIKLSVRMCALTIAGVPVMMVDNENSICVVGGVDYLAGLRSALGE